MDEHPLGEREWDEFGRLGLPIYTIDPIRNIGNSENVLYWHRIFYLMSGDKKDIRIHTADSFAVYQKLTQQWKAYNIIKIF